jgi:hypothetical protein
MQVIEFKYGILATPVIGQEVICPHGLGRIAEVSTHGAGGAQIRVDTYIRNMSCKWSSANVEYLYIPGRR